MAKLSFPIQLNGLEVMLKWMDSHEVVRLPGESEEHHAGYLECWQHIRNGLDRLIGEEDAKQNDHLLKRTHERGNGLQRDL